MEILNFQEYQKRLEAALACLAEARIIERIWKKDWTVWKRKPEEIANRLGWLTAPQECRKILPQVENLVREMRQEGYRRALLLGMGGSSLAPLVLSTIFRRKPGFLELTVLDSTLPSMVLNVSRKLQPAKTLFIVSSKSGTTVETSALFKYFWNQTLHSLGKKEVGRHFIAITDESTPLAMESRRLRFRSLFFGEPDIGGRFSALSAFGLVPAALLGIKLSRILESAETMAEKCERTANLRANPGAFLGAVLATMAEGGRDKLTLLLPSRLRSFGLWLEQLIAESTGKEGKGILPVEGEPPGPPRVYGKDRFFVHIGFNTGTDASTNKTLQVWKKARFPILSLSIPDASSLGGQFFLWEFAIAVAGHFLRINPFDQPDVDKTKKKTHGFLEAYQKTKTMDEKKPCLSEKGVSLFSGQKAYTLVEGLRKFLDEAQPGDYIALQAFLPSTLAVHRRLQELRALLRDKTGLAATLGYGPRYLHSTGQLHKGDGGRGLFLQLTASAAEDIPVPNSPGSEDSALTFGVLSTAQALGDGAALRSSGRRLIRLHIEGEVEKGLRYILSVARECFGSPVPGTFSF